MYTDGSAPAEEPWDPAVAWEKDRAWLRGMDLFDHRYYWEAHEAWEAIWHAVPREDPYAELLQGLIQAAAFLLKQHMGHEAAAKRLQTVCLERLGTVVSTCGSPWRGVDLDRLIQVLNAGSMETLGTVTRPAPGQSDSDPNP
jgi:predicted metal-dependent hydrolase